MAATAAQPPVNGDAKPSSPVDLSTIPISPDGGNTDENKKPSGDRADGDQITVFHDKDNFNVKHPLMHKWTLWFTKPPSGKVCLRTNHCWSIMVDF
jgi:translation initiation factor 4E